MKKIMLTILLLSSLNMTSQSQTTTCGCKGKELVYAYYETLPLIKEQYAKYKNIKKRVIVLLRQYCSYKKGEQPSEKLVNIMVYRMNKAFGYMHVAHYDQINKKHEVRLRTKAIEHAVIYHGWAISPVLVNEEYNLLYGETRHISYHKNRENKKRIRNKRTVKVHTLKNAKVVRGFKRPSAYANKSH